MPVRALMIRPRLADSGLTGFERLGKKTAIREGAIVAYTTPLSGQMRQLRRYKGRTTSALAGTCLDAEDRSFRGKFAEPVGGRNTAVYEEVAAGDERTVQAHKERGNVCDLVRDANAPGR